MGLTTEIPFSVDCIEFLSPMAPSMALGLVRGGAQDNQEVLKCFRASSRFCLLQMGLFAAIFIFVLFICSNFKCLLLPIILSTESCLWL